MKAVVIIPARYGSTRLPAKVLLNKTGKYLVQHTYEQALKAGEVSRVIIATDDNRVAKAIRNFGGDVAMTSPRHSSGTDRIAEVARRLKYPIVVNLQADEPEIDPRIIDRVIKLVRLKGIDIATLACPFRNKQELNDPAKVKVLVDSKGFAIDFSRSKIPPTPLIKGGIKGGIPLLRGESRGNCPLLKGGMGGLRGINRHIGIYAYKRARLLEFTRLLPTQREKQEKLEQLRALENGFRIKVGLIKKAPAGIDTPRDYAQFVSRIIHSISLK